MNNYFSNLAADLTSKENTKSNLTSLLNNRANENYDQSLHLNHTNCNEVFKIITNLKSNCSSGHGNPTSIKDYRPILILLVFSEVYERVIFNQLCSFVETQNLYNINQSGFLKWYSTNTRLLKLQDDIRTAMNRSEVILSILIDYSKAFDTIDHRILLEKLQNMNVTSMYKYRKRDQPYYLYFFGVPQGSILGLALFNFICSRACRPYMFQKISSMPMTPLCIDIARCKHFRNVYLLSKKMWKSCYCGHNKTMRYSTVANINLFYFHCND